MITVAMILGIPLLYVACICLVVGMLCVGQKLFGVNYCPRCEKTITTGIGHTCPPKAGDRP